MDLQRNPRRGRLYSCMHCSRSQVSYVAERYRVVDHIQKHHLALDQAAYYCNLCMFRCVTRDQLEKHLTGYRRHVTMVESLGASPDSVRKHLVANPNPKVITEGIDFQLATPQDHLGRPFARPDDPFEDSQTNVTASNKQELITVQVTPELLASVLSSKVATGGNPAPIATPHTEQDVAYDPTRPSYSGTSIPFGNQDIPFVAATCSTLTLGPQSPSLPLFATGQSVPAFNPTQADHSQRPTPLNTPEPQPNRSTVGSPPGPYEENVLHQILGANTPMTFSPEQSRTDASVAAKVTREQSTQTVATPEQAAERYGPVTSALAHLEKTLQTSMAKVAEAVESSARATRVIGKTMENIADSILSVSRVVDRISEEQRRQGRQGRREEPTYRDEKRPRLEARENQPSASKTSNRSTK